MKFRFVGLFLLVFIAHGSALSQGTSPPAKANKRPPSETTKPEPFDGATVLEMKKCVALDTSEGQIVLEMFPVTAPRTVRNFLNLTAIGAYNNTVFNRIVPGFVIQGGNLFVNPKLSPEMRRRASRTIPDEPNLVRHRRGILSMARPDTPNGASTDFFILLRDAPALDNKFASFGQVIEGMEIVEKINQMPVENEIPQKPVLVSSAKVLKCEFKPEDQTKINDLPRFGLKGKIKSIEETSFVTKGKEKNWKKSKNRLSTLSTEFGKNGNLISTSHFDVATKKQWTEKISGTIWGERNDAEAQEFLNDSEGRVITKTLLKRTGTDSYSFETVTGGGRVVTKGNVKTDQKGRPILRKYEIFDESGKSKGTVTASMKYDAYGFLEIEEHKNANGKRVSYARYDYRGFDESGNWTERYAFTSGGERKACEN